LQRGGYKQRLKENMTTFTPRRINAKASKAGRTYWEIETDQGKATCFDYPIVQEIEKSIGKPISLYDLEANEKGFINIRPAKKQAQPVVAQTQAQAPAPAENFAEARKAKDVSIYTSYAKDLFIEIASSKIAENKTAEEMMSQAIALVKQARDSFKE